MRPMIKLLVLALVVAVLAIAGCSKKNTKPADTPPGTEAPKDERGEPPRPGEPPAPEVELQVREMKEYLELAFDAINEKNAATVLDKLEAEIDADIKADK